MIRTAATARERNQGAVMKTGSSAGGTSGGQSLRAERLDWGVFSNVVGTMVRLLRNELTTRILAAYEPFGLRSGAMSTMVLIHANPGRSQSELAREVALDYSAMVAIMDELEDRGFAVRKRSTTDRRRNVIELTPAGVEMMMTIHACAMGVERPIRDALSPEELATFIDLLRRSYDALLAVDPAAD
jgi:DNA-binding MarR family transcriptional regulator